MLKYRYSGDPEVVLNTNNHVAIHNRKQLTIYELNS